MKSTLIIISIALLLSLALAASSEALYMNPYNYRYANPAYSDLFEGMVCSYGCNGEHLGRYNPNVNYGFIHVPRQVPVELATYNRLMSNQIQKDLEYIDDLFFIEPSFS